ncbi:MAG TPA: 4-(cytidine 5'-diphospho)-2-C-methyl-D-erythritol kinase [Syntrophobacteraceae bacterium]|nr:4-(cytidine 5'-diphospho)-2-C-methyl-D-erythritol kinase [Syntrophobacteraceae bacterium]
MGRSPAGAAVRTFKALAPAKINLWLEVIGKRSDGYHELSSLMLPVGVYDQLDVTLGGTEVSLECSHPDVPQDDRNLAWRAADRFRREAGWSQGMHIKLVKNIPVGAGLGGGSSDAGVLLANLNRWAGAPLATSTLVDLARSLGADVAFFLESRPALARGIGEKLEWVTGVPAYPLVLIKPPVMVSTRSIYQKLTLTRPKAAITIRALEAQPWSFQQVLENDLESVTIVEFPVIAQIKQWLMNNGALGALMSGSGPTVFGVFSDEARARKVESLARETWRRSWVQTTQVLSEPDRPTWST